MPPPVAIGQSPPQPPQWRFNGLMSKETMEVGVEHTDGLEDTDFTEANLPPSSTEVHLANGVNHPLSPNIVFPGWTSLLPGGRWTEFNPFYHEASAFGYKLAFEYKHILDLDLFSAPAILWSASPSTIKLRLSKEHTLQGKKG